MKRILAPMLLMLTLVGCEAYDDYDYYGDRRQYRHDDRRYGGYRDRDDDRRYWDRDRYRGGYYRPRD